MGRDFWEWEEYDAHAQEAYDRGAFEESLDLLREGLTLYPDSAELWISLGYTQLAREEFAWAREAFGRALELDEGHEEAMVGLGDVLLKLGERARAFAAFDAVLELGFAADPDLMLAVARALYREELYERSERFYQLALAAAEAASELPAEASADATAADAAAELAYTLYQMSRADAALPLLERALRRNPTHHEARVFYGNLLYDRGDYGRALRAFEAVPPGKMWDPLAVWRAVELLRGFRGLENDSREVQLLLRQLEGLTEEPSPEDRLIAEVEAAADPLGASGPSRDRQQLDLFVLESARPQAREPGVHAVRASSGRLYTGDWASIVEAMRDEASDPSVSIVDYMRDAARVVRSLTGVQIPDDDPEEFLRASARAGILSIER
ncbi:MAG TPA: tetratricopeptide repeat protein [Gemmatimonadota bacterium]|nr:tetratricopeptide repeat protein [Gemmatimonadota bacterium]